MFDQSVIYLYNAYREQGLSLDEAKDRVARDIEEVHQKYASVLPKLQISSARILVQDVEKMIEALAPKNHIATKQMLRTQVLNKLQQLKTLLV